MVGNRTLTLQVHKKWCWYPASASYDEVFTSVINSLSQICVLASKPVLIQSNLRIFTKNFMRAVPHWLCSQFLTTGIQFQGTDPVVRGST